MSERDYTTEVAGDRSKEPVWCGETVETIAGATGEKEEDVRIWLTLAWKAGYRTRDLQTKLSPALRDWRDVGGPLRIFLEKYMGPAPNITNAPQLSFLISAQIAE